MEQALAKRGSEPRMEDGTGMAILYPEGAYQPKC